MLNKKLGILLICLITVCMLSAVSATENIDNEILSNDAGDIIASGADEVISESLDDSLSMDGEDSSWSDDYIVWYEGDEYTDVDLNVVARPLAEDDKNITLKLTYDDGETPVANVDLAILTNHDYKINKVTTDSRGIAVYNIPFNTNNFSFVAGFWHDEKHIANYANYNGKILHEWLIYRSDNAFWGDIYQEWYVGDENNVIYANLVFTEYTKSSNGKITFRLTETENRTPIANVDLAILTNDYKITKLTTNSKGVAVYNIRSYDEVFDFVVGLWHDGKHISNYASYNGTILKTDYFYSDEGPVPESYYIVSAINRGTGQALAGASVSISNNENEYKGITDSDGKLVLYYIKNGDYKVQVDYQNKSIFKDDGVTINEDWQSNCTENDLLLWNVVLGDNVYLNLYYGEKQSNDVPTNANTVYEGNFKELKDLIDNAKNGSTINLNKDYIGSGEIIVNCNDLTVNGNNHKIDASSASRIFNIYGNKVTLKNIQFCNAYVDGENGQGGAINSYCDNLIINDCKFVNNHAYEGGAIYLDQMAYGVSKTTQLNRIIFENNAADIGGAIYSKQKLNVTDCEFDSNNATSWAGAIFTYNGLMGMSTSFNMQGITVGSITNYYSFPLNISGKTTFKNNRAVRGGAIAISANNNVQYGKYGQLTLNKGVVFENNTANYGGALYLKATESVIDNVVFKDNLATVGGGAISSFNQSTLNVNNSVFTNNDAKNYGGTIYGTYFVTVSNSKFSGEGNIEFIDYENYMEVDGNSVTPYGDFYIENNTMTGNNDFDIFYEGYYSIDFKTKLILGNVSTKLGKPVNLAELQDSNGNSIVMLHDVINVTVKDSTGKAVKDVSLVYNATTGGYGFGTTGLKNGQYAITGQAPELASDCEVVNGILMIGNYVLTANDVTKYYGGSEKYTVTLTDGNKPVSGVNVVIAVNGKEQAVKTDSNGKASIDLSLGIGNYTITTAYDVISTTTGVNVKSTLVCTDGSGEYGKSAVSSTFLNVNGKSLTNKKVTFKVGDKTFTATTNENGVATATVDLDVGTYTVTAVNPVNNEQKQFKFVIAKSSSSISAAYTQNNGVTTLTATLTPNTATGSVIFNINGENRNAAIKNGKATLMLEGLKAANYTVTANYNGDSNLNPSTSNTLTFTVKDVYLVLTANPVTKTYGSSTKLVVNLADNKGNAIANADVNVVINGAATPIKTDAKGQATLAISKAPGTYNAIITYLDAQTTAKITVKKATPKITAKAKSFKKSDNVKKYTVTLKNNKKLISGVTVKIMVNKKTYSAKTKKGVATFKLSKLTKKGNFKATVKFAGNKYYNSKTVKNVKITVK